MTNWGEPSDEAASSFLSQLAVPAAAIVLLTSACAGQRDWQSVKGQIRDEFPSVNQMTVEELSERLVLAEGGETASPLLVDVRASSEYAVSHLPGAVNASGEALRALIGQQDGQRKVVLYCSVGYRSSAEAEGLLAQGIEGIFNLEGSIFEWANTGHPVYRDGLQVEAVHPFDEDWGKLLDPRFHAYTVP